MLRWLGRFGDGGGHFVGHWTHRSRAGGEDDGHMCSCSLFNCNKNEKEKKNIPLGGA